MWTEERKRPPQTYLHQNGYEVSVQVNSFIQGQKNGFVSPVEKNSRSKQETTEPPWMSFQLRKSSNLVKHSNAREKSSLRKYKSGYVYRMMQKIYA